MVLLEVCLSDRVLICGVGLDIALLWCTVGCGDLPVIGVGGTSNVSLPFLEAGDLYLSVLARFHTCSPSSVQPWLWVISATATSPVSIESHRVLGKPEAICARNLVPLPPGSP